MEVNYKSMVRSTRFRFGQFIEKNCQFCTIAMLEKTGVYTPENERLEGPKMMGLGKGKSL